MKTVRVAIVLSFVLAAFAGGYVLALRRTTPDSLDISAGMQQRSGPPPLTEPLHRTERLRGELLETRKKVRDLERLNAALTAQLERLNLSFLSSLTYEGMVQKIDSMPERSIRDKLGHLFAEKALGDIGDIREFSKRALDVALDDRPEDNGALSASIVFSTSPMRGVQTIAATATIGRHDAVFAHIDSDTLIGTAVVKWQNTGTGEILVFGDQFLGGSSGNQYVATKPPGGWAPGSYRVSLFSMDEKMIPFASNSYSLASILENDVADAQQRLINELVQTGQAVPKTR